MTTQLLIYETAVPVSSGRHGKCAVEAGKGYAFARKLNSVPLMAVEFPQAAPEYAVVFAQSGDDVVPVVILGARQNENLYLGSDDAWQAKYIAAIQCIVYCVVLETANKNLCSDISILGFLRKATLKCGDDLRFPCSRRTNNDGDIRSIECCIQRQRLLLSRLSAFEGFQRIGRQPIH